MNKKLIDLEGLKQYSKKIKENYVAKDADGNVVIQGNLEIKGISQTINQETLTIKDNFIAVNGDGTTLDTAGMAGIIAITGEENINLKPTAYYIDTKKLGKVLDVENYYNNHPTEGFTNFVSDKFNSVFASVGFSLYADGDFINIKKVEGMLSMDSAFVNNSSGNFIYGANIRFELSGIYTEPLIVASQSDVEFLKSFLLDSNQQPITSAHFETKGQAYAAPIYDKTEDTLKIGLGNYEKDADGNVTKFEFGAGQGQSIATRANDIEDSALVAWDDTQKKLVDSEIKLVETYATDISMKLPSRFPGGSNGPEYYTELVSGPMNGGLLIGKNNSTGTLTTYYKQDEIQYVETNSDGVLKNAIIKIPKNNGFTSQTLATQEWVQENLPEVDLTEYATKAYTDERFNGANKAVSFDSYQDMITSLNAITDKNVAAQTYAPGQNIYIRTLNVPDLWVYGITPIRLDYTYTTDEAFMHDLEVDHTVRVGSFILAALETQKAELTDYAKTEDVNTELSKKLDSFLPPAGGRNSYDECVTITNGLGQQKALDIAGAIGTMKNGALPRYWGTNFTSNAIPTGVLVTGTPHTDSCCANKKYVDDKITELQESSDIVRKEYLETYVAEEITKVNTSPFDSMKQMICDAIYPTGSIYMSMNATDPSVLFGGTWERLKDQFLLGAGDTYPAGIPGGEAEVKLEETHIPSHSHSINHTHTDGQHAHLILLGSENVAGTGGQTVYSDTANPENGHKWVATTVNESGYTGDHTHSYTGNSGTYGGNQAHNNMPPYLAVYMWKRIS